MVHLHVLICFIFNLSFTKGAPASLSLSPLSRENGPLCHLHSPPQSNASTFDPHLYFEIFLHLHNL